MATVAQESQRGPDAALPAAVHQVLIALANLRTGSPSPERLRQRIPLTRWLRDELTAVEALLSLPAPRAAEPAEFAFSGTPEG